MSEDVLRLRFKLTGQAGSLKNIRNHIEKKIYKKPPREIDESQKGRVCKLHFSMGEAVSDKIVEESLRFVEKQGGKDVIASTWIDHAGEEMWAALINDRLQYAESEKQLLQVIADAKQPPAVLHVFEKFLRKGIDRKAVIKLQTSDSKKGEQIERLFSILLKRSDANAYQTFAEAYAKCCKEKKQPSRGVTFRTEWCRFQPSHMEGRWFDGPAEIAKGVEFVIRQENETYIGMDLENVETAPYQSAENIVEEMKHLESLGNLLYVLVNLNGVKKAWIRFQYRDAYVGGEWPIPFCDVPNAVVIPYRKKRPEYEW